MLLNMNIRTLLRVVFLLVLISLLGGCENEYNSSHQSDGDKLIIQLHQAIQQGQWDDLQNIYSSAYLEQNSTQMIQERWQRLIRKYGKLKGFQLRTKQKDARLQGEFYMYSYAVLFAHATISETITVFRSGQDDSITISGHRLAGDN
ncbi:MAG: hypothetical protein R8J85_07810 [Mariprofundales bacterium]